MIQIDMLPKRALFPWANITYMGDKKMANLEAIQKLIERIPEIEKSFYSADIGFFSSYDWASIMELERMRKSIRDLIKFAKSEGEAIHYTEFEDTWTERTEGVGFDDSEYFEDYEEK